MTEKKRMTWDKWAAIVAPFIAVIFFAGIAQSEIKANSRNTDALETRLIQVEQDAAESRADYKHILRVLERLENKIDSQQ